MLHLMLPPYERSLDTVLLVEGDQVGDFSTQLLNAFFKVMKVHLFVRIRLGGHQHQSTISQRLTAL